MGESPLPTALHGSPRPAGTTAATVAPQRRAQMHASARPQQSMRIRSCPCLGHTSQQVPFNHVHCISECPTLCVTHAAEAIAGILQLAARSGRTSTIVVIMLQECGSRSVTSVLLGSTSWHLVGEPNSASSLSSRSSPRGLVQDWGGQSRITWATTSTTLFISVYLPGCGKEQEEYEATLEQIRGVVRRGRGRGRFK